MRLIGVLVLAGIVGCSPAGSIPLPLPAGAGSAQPNLATGPDGTLVLSYMEPAGDAATLRYTTLESDGWSEPQTLVGGQDLLLNWADFPSVVPLAGHLWAAHWLREIPGPAFAYDAMLMVSTDGGVSWSEPQPLHADGTVSEHGFVSLYASGSGVGAIWLDGRAMAGRSHGAIAPSTASAGAGDAPGTQLMAVTVAPATPGAEVVSAEEAIDRFVCDCCQTDVAVASSGPVAAYRNRSREEIRDIHVARQIDGEWQSGRPVAADGWKVTGCPVNGPAIVAAAEQVAVAWFTAQPRNRVQVAFSSDSGATFAKPIDVGADRPIGRVDIVLDGKDAAIVSWVEQGLGELLIRRIASDGQLGEIHTVTSMNTHRQAGFPQMARTADALVFAWTDTLNDQSRVRSLQVPF